MKKSMKVFLATSIITVAVSAFANLGLAKENDEKVIIHNDKEYRAILVTPELTAASSEIVYDDSFKVKTKVLEDREKLSEWVKTYHKDKYAGTYTDENGNNVILITEDATALEKEIKNQSAIPDMTKIIYVKYSDNQLKEYHKKVNDYVASLRVDSFVATNNKDNKINIAISEDIYKKNKDTILKLIPIDLVSWTLGDIKVTDQAYYEYPGEQIERKIDSTSYLPCSLGFNALIGTSRVGVTAGHCLNGTYYDLSDGTASIGTMSNGVAAGSNFDGGSVSLVAAANHSVYLNGSLLTIGTFDYNGSRQEAGDSVLVHATSFGGTSGGPVTVVSSSVSVNNQYGTTTDCVQTYNAGTIGGDSGGLWYSIINNGTKNYAVIEGIHKAAATVNGTTYNFFSKFSNVYNGLGLSGVYVDSTY